MYNDVIMTFCFLFNNQAHLWMCFARSTASWVFWESSVCLSQRRESCVVSLHGKRWRVQPDNHMRTHIHTNRLHYGQAVQIGYIMNKQYLITLTILDNTNKNTAHWENKSLSNACYVFLLDEEHDWKTGQGNLMNQLDKRALLVIIHSHFITQWIIFC